MTTMADSVVKQMSPLTRQHVLEEGKRDDSFWPYFTRLARQPDPGKTIDDEMKRAAINELDPSRYTEMKGKWPVLRSKLRYIKGHIEAHAYIQKTGTMGGLSAMGYTDPVTGITTFGDSPTASSSGGTDIWSTIGKVLSSVGTAAGQVYATKITTGAQQDIAKIQAQAAQGIALTQQQQQALAQAQAAAASGSSSNTILYILLGVLGLGGIALLFSLLQKRR